MSHNCFAIIPAAGLSSRMGKPKLLLSVGGQPLIVSTILAWKQSRVSAVFVVVRPGDFALAEVCEQQGVTVITPNSPPPDMKASVQAALKHIEHHLSPNHADAFLVAPADMPRLSPAIIDRLIERHSAQQRLAILAPEIAGQRGHPVLFPWPLSERVHGLAADLGLNALVDREALELLPCDDLLEPNDQPFADIDTPEDYENLR